MWSLSHITLTEPQFPHQNLRVIRTFELIKQMAVGLGSGFGYTPSLQQCPSHGRIPDLPSPWGPTVGPLFQELTSPPTA